jgi:hypothetical protein
VKREFQRDEGCGVGEEEPLSTTEVPVLACGLPDIGGGVGGGTCCGTCVGGVLRECACACCVDVPREETRYPVPREETR